MFFKTNSFKTKVFKTIFLRQIDLTQIDFKTNILRLEFNSQAGGSRAGGPGDQVSFQRSGLNLDIFAKMTKKYPLLNLILFF